MGRDLIRGRQAGGTILVDFCTVLESGRGVVFTLSHRNQSAGESTRRARRPAASYCAPVRVSQNQIAY